jgi:hypothetical protein
MIRLRYDRCAVGRDGVGVLDSFPMKRLLALVVSLVVAGCVSTTTVARDRFANEHGCPTEHVMVGDPAGNRYPVHGCNEQATYICTNTLFAFKGGARCTELARLSQNERRKSYAAACFRV